MKNCLIPIIFLLLISCGGQPTKPTEVVVRGHLEIDCGVPPSITPIVWNNVDFWVVPPLNSMGDNLTIPKYLMSYGDQSIWGLTTEDYQNLAINTDQFIRYQVQAGAVILHYEKCIEAFNKRAVVEPEPILEKKSFWSRINPFD